MKTLLKNLIGSLALLACLSNPAFAAESAPQPTPHPVAQPQVEAPQVVVGPLAWQRVGSPLSLDA
jgi:hypothetical protein